MFIRFILVGSAGFGIDAGVTFMLIQLSVVPWIARIPAIGLAMAFTWLANRYFTYKVKKMRTAHEALRYFIVALSMALMNYLIYLLLVNYQVWPVAAVSVATACQTFLSFHAYRSFVFMEPVAKSSSKKKE